MIRAQFSVSGERILSCRVSGHAGFAEHGRDIVCASVTSALQMAINGITEVLEVPADVSVLEDEISVELPENSPDAAYAFLQALRLHLQILSEDYKGTIQLKVSVVS